MRILYWIAIPFIITLAVVYLVIFGVAYLVVDKVMK